MQPMNITFGTHTPYRFPCILLFLGNSSAYFATWPESTLCPLHRFHPHTLTQRNLYRLTSIVETNVFESNGPRRANQNVDHTSGNPALDEFGQPADLAAQPKLGVLPEWGLGPGRRHPTRFVTSWKNLKLVADWKSGDPLSARRAGTGSSSERLALERSVDCKKQGDLHVYCLVCSFVACVAGWFLGLPRIQRVDSYSVAARGHLADCPFFSAPDRLVND
jgi:hypothetical protein